MNRTLRYLFPLLCAALLAACSTTRRLGEGEVLYTGVKKMKITEAVDSTGRDGAVFRFSLIPYHENAYHVLALAGEDGQVIRLLALLPNDTLEELDLLLASPDA